MTEEKPTTAYNEIKSNPQKVTTPGEETKDHPKFKPVVSAPAKKAKRGILERLVNTLIGPEGIPAVGKKLNKDIVIPALKELLVNSISAGIQQMVYHGDAPKSNQTYYGPNSGTSYNSYYKQKNQYTGTQPVEPVSASNFNSRRYVMASYQEASNVLENLIAAADQYDWVSLADFYDLIAVSSDNPMDNGRGWNDGMLRTARVITVRGGFAVDLPFPMPED